MAKTSYLNLTNKILRLVNQSTISDVTAATGHALIITNLINEAQLALFTETNWYSLYTSRTFNTSASTAEYAVASDFGRTITLIDTTNNMVLSEDIVRAIDETDPDADTTGQPTHFAFVGSNYKLYPIPAGTYTIRDRYWKQPTALSANADTSDLPIEVENCIISWTHFNMLQYLKDFDAADRMRINYEKTLNTAKAMNKRMIDQMNVFNYGAIYNDTTFGIAMPRFPAKYGARYY